MMSLRTKLNVLSFMDGTNTVSAYNGQDGVGEVKPENWELRPCGLLVQKRIDVDQNIKPIPRIQVQVKYGSIYHDICINSQATFGELKKMLCGPTGLHHEDQKVYYKDKERNSKEFLDVVGVKDKSKLVLMEDPISHEKRVLEMRRKAIFEKAVVLVSEISLRVDKLADQVAVLESVIFKGGRVSEKEIVNLIELLMNELVKLDGIGANGDVKLQRQLQVKRVQKYVETLDLLKAKNSMPAANGVRIPNGNRQKVANGRAKNSVFTGNGLIHSNNQDRTTKVGKPPLPPKQQQRHSIGHSPLPPQPQRQRQERRRHSTSGTVVTTEWEKFDSAPQLIALSTSSSQSTPEKPEKPNLPWEFFE